VLVGKSTIEVVGKQTAGNKWVEIPAGVFAVLFFCFVLVLALTGGFYV